MPDLKISSKLQKESSSRLSISKSIGLIRSKVSNSKEGIVGEDINIYRYVPSFVVLLFIIFFLNIINLQIIQGTALYDRSTKNSIEIEEVEANRGLILDRNGVPLAINVPSSDIVVELRKYRKNGKLDKENIVSDVQRIESVLPEKYVVDGKKISVQVKEKLDGLSEYDQLYKDIIVLAPEVDNSVVVDIKSRANEVVGITAKESSKRSYPYGKYTSHLLGYTGIVFAEDLERLKYADLNDQIGKSGLERYYDERLIGVDGEVIWEVDSLVQRVSDSSLIAKEVESGVSLKTSIDINRQKRLFDIMQNGVKMYNADGGAAIIMDVNSGEIISMVSYPSFDNNLFIGGISADSYNSLLTQKGSPLNNKAISAQVPPGSTFKTIVAASALDAGVINRSTRFISRSNYTFSNGAPFQEYQDRAYGSLDIIDALSVSSNIYFCETIRKWNMDSLVPYLSKFGIGEYTGIDIYGEGLGMLPSPANKIALAKSTSPWLDPVWYPEGDSCNSVIGQGITTVTPIQMVVWVGAIANGGKLHTPHLGREFVDEKGNTSAIPYSPKRANFISSSSLSTVAEGMYSAVNGPRRTIGNLTNLPVTVAAKTGTAEFGRLNSKGQYENTHAWVTGFWPYEKPKYAFVVFLENGGESYNAAKLAAEYISKDDK